MKNIVICLCLLASVMLVEGDLRCSDNYQHFSHEFSCSKFYSCDGVGNAVLNECDNGLHFNAKLFVCDWPDHANCQIKAPKNDAPKTCPPDEDPRFPTHLPHPTDCTKFYKCYNGEAYLENCPPGLHWNINKNYCDWPKDAKCDLQSTTTSTTTTSTTTTTAVPPPITTTTTKQPETDPKGCPLDEDPKNPTHLPHQTDCTKFYKCLNGKPFLLDCPPGLHWNIKMDYCDYPRNAQCKRPL